MKQLGLAFHSCDFWSQKIHPKGRILEVGEGRELLGVVVNFGYTFLTTPPPWTLPPNPESRAWIPCLNLQIWVLCPNSEVFYPKISSNFGFTQWRPHCSPRRKHLPWGWNPKEKNTTPKTPFQLFFLWAQEPTPASTSSLPTCCVSH